MDSHRHQQFAAFFEAAESRLRLALVGAFGLETGRDAAAEALAWGWQNWDRLEAMDNPVGYLYKVGRTKALRAVEADAGKAFLGSAVDGAGSRASSWEMPHYEPELLAFLADLPEQQRVAVWMVHGLGFTNQEVADLLECSRNTIATHVRRALRKLRHHLGVDHA